MIKEAFSLTIVEILFTVVHCFENFQCMLRKNTNPWVNFFYSQTLFKSLEYICRVENIIVKVVGA